MRSRPRGAAQALRQNGRDPARVRASQASGSSISASVGICSGPSQTRLSAAMPPDLTTASQKRLPSSYWRSLRSIPISFSKIRSSPERSRRRRSSAPRSFGRSRQHLGADGVHDVLRVALEHAP